MATYYAWSDIKAGTLDQPKLVRIGEKVSKSDFPGMNDADWDALLSGGSVRDKPYPAPEDYPGSVIDYYRDQLAEAQAGTAVEVEEATVELAAVETVQEAPVKSEEKPAAKK